MWSGSYDQGFLIWSVSCPLTVPKYGPISSSTFAVYVPSATMTGVSHTPLQPNFIFCSASTLPSLMRVRVGDMVWPARLTIRSVQPFLSFSPAETSDLPSLFRELISHLHCPPSRTGVPFNASSTLENSLIFPFMKK